MNLFFFFKLVIEDNIIPLGWVNWVGSLHSLLSIVVFLSSLLSFFFFFVLDISQDEVLLSPRQPNLLKQQSKAISYFIPRAPSTAIGMKDYLSDPGLEEIT